MAKPTERALKRKPMAVILLTTLRKDVPNVPDGAGGREFEWFETREGVKTYFDQNVEYHKSDTKDHDDMAYMAIEILDTATMKLGRVDVRPQTDETKAWMAEIKADITKAFQPVKEVTETKDSGQKVVRPRRKSAAAGAVQKDASKTKAARLKERLAAKQEPKGTGDKPPARKAPAKKAAAKKVSPAAEPEFIVRKASTAPIPDPTPEPVSEEATAATG